MSRLATLLLTIILATPAVAQSAPNSQSTEQPKSPANPTLRTGTTLVIVDVVVTDQQHHPVHNLKRSDFTLREDNVSQPVKVFEEYTPATGTPKSETMPALPPGVFTNITIAPTNGPANILLLDTLNTATNDQSRVRLQLLDFLDKAKPGTRIAIFGLTTRLTLMQGFTDDPKLLKTALSKSNPKSSPLLLDPSGGGGSQFNMSEGLAEAAQGSSMGPAIRRAGAKAQEFEAVNTASQTTSRAKYTLDAMNALARYLVAIPGRKNLIWFSGSFPIDILPDPSIVSEGSTNPFAPTSIAASSADEFRETTNMLARSQVAVYPVSARGVTLLPTTNAANSGAQNVGRSSAQAQADANSSTQIFDEHSTMRQMAHQTGGRAFVDTNGLTQAVNDSIYDGSSYYTIAYTPANTNWNGAYRKIEVQIQRQGLDLSYRRGYYADDPDGTPRRNAAVAPAPRPATLAAAMQRGTPNTAQIIFDAHIVPTSAGTEKALAPNNQGIKTLKGPYRRYTIGIAADPTSMTFITSPDGSRHGSIEIVTFVYEADGSLVNTVGSTIQADFAPAVYAKYRKGGVPFKQEISVPAKGTYFLRIAVHDLPSDRIGSLEVPIAAVQNLPPAQPLPALLPN